MREHEVFNLLSHLHVSLLLFYSCEIRAYTAGSGRPNGCYAHMGAQYSTMGVSAPFSTGADDRRQMYFTKQVEYITRYIDTYGHIIDQYGSRVALKFHFGVSSPYSQH